MFNFLQEYVFLINKVLTIIASLSAILVFLAPNSFQKFEN